MPFLIKNHFENAYDSLKSNRMRTTLTILGVAIGVASIVVILSLSAGASSVIKSQVSEISGGVGIIRPGSPTRSVQVNNITSTLAGNQYLSSLTAADVDAVSKVPNVSAVAPMMLIGGGVKSSTHNPDTVSIVATTPELPKIVNLPLDTGQFIDSTTRRDTAVIGSQLAIDLFGTHQAVGRTFTTHGADFTVIGILRPLNNPINYNHIDFDHTAIISLDSGKEFNQGIVSLQQINFKTDKESQLEQAVAQIDKAVKANHNGETDYEIVYDGSLADPTNELFNTVAATLTAVAAISLVVGGIGIMNIMLVSVTERTREIGVRKAIGASNAHITWQFLIESLVMSVAGGLLGYIAGYFIAFTIARTFLTFIPTFTWEIVGISVGISLVVGILFGLYPALRASNKDPIEALRQYH